MREDELRRFRLLVAERAAASRCSTCSARPRSATWSCRSATASSSRDPETELLAGWGIEHARSGDIVVDLCSGTGAIALSMADEIKTLSVYAVERSPVALSFLRRNGRRVSLRPRRRGRRRRPRPHAFALASRCGGAVQPPYVPDGTPVHAEVADHDPAEAVFGGADGLDVIRPVIALAARLLKSGGHVGIEHDDVHGDVVPALLRRDGRFAEVTAHRDLAGRPRFATARRT
jgi:release factor glutamine methyltransferase